jgi:hypothetical protein
MLHTASPTDYLAADELAEPATCPDCGSHTILSFGVVHLGHYSYDGDARVGLIWTCSDRCFLSWEHPDFMGRC